jgi:hypothetical protein
MNRGSGARVAPTYALPFRRGHLGNFESTFENKEKSATKVSGLFLSFTRKVIKLFYQLRFKGIFSQKIEVYFGFVVVTREHQVVCNFLLCWELWLLLVPRHLERLRKKQTL